MCAIYYLVIDIRKWITTNQIVNRARGMSVPRLDAVLPVLLARAEPCYPDRAVGIGVSALQTSGRTRARAFASPSPQQVR